MGAPTRLARSWRPVPSCVERLVLASHLSNRRCRHWLSCAVVATGSTTGNAIFHVPSTNTARPGEGEANGLDHPFAWARKALSQSMEENR